MSDDKDTGVIVLAAGSSSRLGEPKQLVEFKDQPLLQKVIKECEPLTFGSGIIVLGSNAEEIQQQIDPGSFTFVINEKWREGIASSIRKGVEETLKNHPDTENLLFLLSDQPFVSTELIRQLLTEHRKETKEITASSYKGDIGVPAIFSKSLFPLLLELSGDQGAKKIMKQHPERVVAVPFEMGHFDVDTPEDRNELHNFES
ncbi:nucleotidyltransferase family protein [Balneolaceae bacterium YR4-1]|uniref:Nucleotidyltransferase family protein n=1 Tax=Halalkalibaculum roseum TaxID=2709311 RepID=A0A6M1SQP7_9BACT|nr:nucleotidyltransferase family protein [Halalkalibaculum roseum]NGP75032.1 nucleotidyltransferase family protein [Halalkalibaculum roseum]